jgi:hypothetical protein
MFDVKVIQGTSFTNCLVQSIAKFLILFFQNRDKEEYCLLEYDAVLSGISLLPPVKLLLDYTVLQTCLIERRAHEAFRTIFLVYHKNSCRI